MAVPLVGSPPPAPKYANLIDNNSARFVSSLGNWFNTGGTLTRDTTSTWLYPSWGGVQNPATAKWVTTDASQRITLPVPGVFKAGVRYDALVAFSLEETPGSYQFDMWFGLPVTDYVNGLAIGSATIGLAPGAGKFRVYVMSWIPIADRTGVTIVMNRVLNSAFGTQTVHVGHVAVARVERGLGLWASSGPPGSVADATGLTAGGATQGFTLSEANQDAQFQLQANEISIFAGAGLIGLDLNGVPNPAGTYAQFYGWVEHDPGDYAAQGYELDVGTDYVSFWISEKDSNTVQLYGNLDQDNELADRGTGAWKARDSAGNQTGSLAKSPFRSLAAAPGSPAEGDCYYDTTTHKLRVYNGTTWNDCW